MNQINSEIMRSKDSKNPLKMRSNGNKRAGNVITCDAIICYSNIFHSIVGFGSDCRFSNAIEMNTKLYIRDVSAIAYPIKFD